MDTHLKTTSVRDVLENLTLRIEIVENFISHQFGNVALTRFNYTKAPVQDSANLSETFSQRAKNQIKKNRENNVLKRKSYSAAEDCPSSKTRKRTRFSQRINYKEDDSESEGESDDFNTLLVPKLEVEDLYYEQQCDAEEVSSNDDKNDEDWNHNSDQELGEMENPRRSKSHIENDIFIQKLKKIVETSDSPISEIVKNALNETTEDIRETLPKVETIKNILRKVRKEKLGTISKPRTFAPHIDQLIQKLKKQEEENQPTKKDKRRKRTSKFQNGGRHTNRTSSLNHSLSNKVVAEDENDDAPLLIPKIEMDIFGGDANGADDDESEILDINATDTGRENINGNLLKADSTLNDLDEIEAPWLKEDYVPPVIFRSACGRVLVFQEYTYCQERKPKQGEAQEIGKKSWKCSTGRVRGRDQCKARMYTWGPDYKVLGIVGEHNHPPRTQKLEKEVFMKKLKELVQTTDMPINEIISNALKDASNEMKANLPKIESIQKVLRKCRASDPRPTSIMPSHKTKIDFLIKQLNENNESTKKQNDTNFDSETPSKNTTENNTLNTSCDDVTIENDRIISCSEDLIIKIADFDIEAPWMKEDYVAPVLFQSACGHVLVYKEYTYCQERKPKNGELQENVKQSWRCSVCGTRGRDKCWARMYTWGTEYKVLAIVGEHNHPPRTQKIEKEIFMKTLKEVVRTTDIPISEAISNALKDASEEMKANLPKIESIQKTLRRVRDSKSHPKSAGSDKCKIDHLVKHLKTKNDNADNNSNSNSY